MSVAAWPPTRFSAPLSEDFPSLFGQYAAVLRVAWRIAMGYELDSWQESLLRAVTELFPDGHERAGQLRWRQVLISVGRQNGKSELSAALGLLFLLARTSPYVIGIASSVDQARLVYKRAMRVILGNKALRRRFDALTETRGIRANDGGQWELKAAKSAALQGIPIDLGIVDEVHLVVSDLWNDLVNGTGGRPNTLVAGITTAGDDSSLLLKDLYKLSDEGSSERFGFFIWEAPESRVPDDDETLTEFLQAANPSVACGRTDVENAISDVRSMPPADAIRYRLNRFVSATNSLITPELWRNCTRGEGESFPEGRPVIAVDRTPDWSHACITASVLDDSGVLHTEVVASVVKPDLDQLEAVCLALAPHSPAFFVMDGYALKELGSRLKRNGFQTQVLSQGDVVSASSMFYAKVVQRRLIHAGDALLTAQIPKTARKNVGTGFRVSRADSTSEIDAVMSTLMGVYVAETAPVMDDQLFV